MLSITDRHVKNLAIHPSLAEYSPILQVNIDEVEQMTREQLIVLVLKQHAFLEKAVVLISEQDEDVETERDYTKDLRDQLATQDSVLNANIEEKIYQSNLFANPDLSSSEKLVLLASRNVVRELRADDDVSLADFHLNTIANQTGLTTETVGLKLHRLDAVFNTVEYETKKVYAGKDRQGKKLYVSDTKLAILPLADQPQAIQLPETAPRHGGPREKKVCPTCGSDKIQRATHTHCLECKHTLELTVHMVNEEMVGLEQSDADALFMLNTAVENATPSSIDDGVPQTENYSHHCTCTQPSENHHDENMVIAPVEAVSLVNTQETPEYKPAWKCSCRDAYKGWYWSSSVKVWRCTGCHKDASATRQKVML